MTADTFPPQDQGKVDVLGAQLRYRIEGNGPACLVVGSSVVYPREFSTNLRRHLRLVFVDLRHFVEPEQFLSADPSFDPGGISLDTYADDIELVREALDLGDVVVIGHSVHANVALEYARRYPEHVRGVVAIGGWPTTEDGDAPGEAHWEAEASDDRKELLARRAAELTPEVVASLSPSELFVRRYVANGPWFWYDPTYDASWLWDDALPDAPVLQRLNELLDPYDLAQGPGRIGMPVLIAQGRYEFGTPWTVWQANLHKLAQPTLAVFEKSAHTPQLEEPERFDEVLLDWLASLSPERGSAALP